MKMLKSINKGLTDKGVFVLDFLNSTSVIENLVPKESKIIDGITFNLNRVVREGCIKKKISFEADGLNYRYEESVQAIGLTELKSLFKSAGLDILDTFGSYNLDPFDENKSKRLILVAQKS